MANGFKITAKVSKFRQIWSHDDDDDVAAAWREINDNKFPIKNGCTRKLGL